MTSIAVPDINLRLHGVVLALYPADPAFEIEVQRAPDDGFGAPDVGSAEILARLGANRDVYVDQTPATSTVYWYRWRHVRAGYTAGAWTEWVGARPVQLDGTIPRPRPNPLLDVELLIDPDDGDATFLFDGEPAVRSIKWGFTVNGAAPSASTCQATDAAGDHTEADFTSLQPGEQVRLVVEAYDAPSCGGNLLGTVRISGALGTGFGPGGQLRQVGETARTADDVTYGWTRGSAVKYVSVLDMLHDRPAPSDPWDPANAVHVRRDVLPTGTDSLTVAFPRWDRIRYVQLEAVIQLPDGTYRVADVERIIVEPRPLQAGTLEPRLVKHSNNSLADVFVTLDSAEGENQALRFREQEGSTVWTLCAAATNPTTRYVAPGTEVGPSDWFTDGAGNFAQKLNDVDLPDDQTDRLYLQAEAQGHQTRSTWVAVALPAREYPRLGNVWIWYDDATGELVLSAIGGTFIESGVFRVATDQGFTADLQSSTVAMTPGGRTDVRFTIADPDQTWYGEVTPHNAAAGGGLAGRTEGVALEILPPDGTVNTQHLADASVIASKLREGAQGWSSDLDFTPNGDDQVDWGTGTVRFADGSSYSIAAGNTGVMAAGTRYHVYFDSEQSTTALQVTTDFSVVAGDEDRVLLAVCKKAPNADEEAFVVPAVGLLHVNSENIVTAAIRTGQLAAGAVTAAKITVAQLSAIAADVGVLTAGRLEDGGGTRGILLSGSLPGAWTTYLNLIATGSDPVLLHPALSLKADGTADFSGTVSADTFTASEASFNTLKLGTGHALQFGGIVGSVGVDDKGVVTALTGIVYGGVPGGIQLGGGGTYWLRVVGTGNGVVQARTQFNATSGTTTRDAAAFASVGAYWNGSQSTDVEMRAVTVVTSTTPDYYLAVRNDAGTDVVLIHSFGKMELRGDGTPRLTILRTSASIVDGNPIATIDAKGTDDGEGFGGLIIFRANGAWTGSSADRPTDYEVWLDPGGGGGVVKGMVLEKTRHLRLKTSPGDPSTLAEWAHIYVKGIGGPPATAEVFVQDDAGNSAQLSPHDPETGEWYHYGYSARRQVWLTVRVERLLRDLIDRVGLDEAEYILEEAGAA